MLKQTVSCLTVLLLCATFIVAQSSATHLMGTVTEVKPDKVTIKTADGKSETVMLEKTTKYMMHDKPAKSTDLKNGESVTINAKMDPKTKKYAAEEIMLGATDTKTQPRK